MPWIGVQAEFVVAAAQVLDERMSSANHSGRAKPFQPTHRSQPALEPTMIGFDGIVRVLLHDVARGGQQLIGHCCIGDQRKRAGWVDASSPSPSVRTEIRLRRVSVPAGDDHLGGAVVPALRAVLP